VAVSGDPVRRRAARTATLVALPVAVLTGLTVAAVTTDTSRPDRGRASTAAAPSRPPATGPVTVPPATAPVGPTRGSCARLIGALPTDLDGRKARPVTSGAGTAAAWGDPPVILRCGVPPVTVPPGTQLLQVNGVSWFARAVGTTAVIFTTVDRVVTVEVTVPAAVVNPAEPIATLSGQIGATLEAR